MRLVMVEDDPNDVLLVSRALRGAGVELELEVLRDGAAAIARVEQGGMDAAQLVLLDWKLPRRSGAEVLEALRRREATRDRPVVVLSSSDLPTDVQSALAAGANGYVAKPTQAAALRDRIAALAGFWLVANRAPSP
jgi:two-component system response regulator